MSANSKTNSRDWFLISIVGAILVLIIISFIFALRGPEPLEYRTGSGPEDVAYNYFIALQVEDYDQAYQYLWTGLENYPETNSQFFEQVQFLSDFQCRIGSQAPSTFSIGNIETFEDRAVISIEESFAFDRPGIFDTGGSQFQSISIRLINIEDDWQITDSNRCWYFEWNDPQSDE